jgi:hypothetical protein
VRGYAQSIEMYKQHLLEVNHKPEDNHKWSRSVNIARRKHNWYTGKEDILNGGNKQCLTLYEQDMNEEAYCDGSGTDLWIGSDRIWHPELWMRSANVWDMTRQETLSLIKKPSVLSTSSFRMPRIRRLCRSHSNTNNYANTMIESNPRIEKKSEWERNKNEDKICVWICVVAYGAHSLSKH